MIYIRINWISYLWNQLYRNYGWYLKKTFHISYMPYKYFSTISDILLDIRDIPFFQKKVFLFKWGLEYYVSHFLYIRRSNLMPCMCQRYHISYVSVSTLYLFFFYPNEISQLISQLTDVRYKKWYITVHKFSYNGYKISYFGQKISLYIHFISHMIRYLYTQIYSLINDDFRKQMIYSSNIT